MNEIEINGAGFIQRKQHRFQTGEPRLKELHCCHDQTCSCGDECPLFEEERYEVNIGQADHGWRHNVVLHCSHAPMSFRVTHDWRQPKWRQPKTDEVKNAKD